MLNRPLTTRREMMTTCLATAFLLRGARAASAAGASGDFRDGFDQRTDSWTPVTGRWSWGKGFVEQTELKREIAILALSRDVPAEYEARTRLRLVEGPTFRSAGILFGYRDPDNYAGVYVTSVGVETESFGPKVQVLYREQGRDHYPPARMSHSVKNGTWYELAISVRSTHLRVLVDDTQVLDYSRPPVVGKRLGLFAFDVRAEFDQFQVRW